MKTAHVLMSVFVAGLAASAFEKVDVLSRNVDAQRADHASAVDVINRLEADVALLKDSWRAGTM